jgi:DNA topoisomerase-1
MKSTAFATMPRGSLEYAVLSSGLCTENKMIKVFKERPEVQLLNGRYGAYLKIGKDNFKLPKDVTPENLTLEECIKISESQEAKPKKKKPFKKK